MKRLFTFDWWLSDHISQLVQRTSAAPDQTTAFSARVSTESSNGRRLPIARLWFLRYRLCLLTASLRRVSPVYRVNTKKLKGTHFLLLCGSSQHFVTVASGPTAIRFIFLNFISL